MPPTLKLSKADVRRALVRQHFEPCKNTMQAFDKLRSIQFDPLAPAGCNHDLVLQARVAGYKVGDWEKTAYRDRLVYDGWDKMASLVPYEGWPVRRFIHSLYRDHFGKKIFEDHSHAVDAVLKEIIERGPLMPRDFDFQQRKEEWKGSWFGPSVTKQTLRALWHTGMIMTSGRKNGQHIYDLTERIVPKPFLNAPTIDDRSARCELVLERHRAMGIVRPSAPPEIWSYTLLHPTKMDSLAELLAQGAIVPVEVEGMKAHAIPEFLDLLDKPSIKPRVVFIGPLDQFMWDRKMIAHVFGFDYVWEVYVPEKKRRWGYYVLPVLFGDELVARVEFYCRNGVMEIRQWHFEQADVSTKFLSELERSLRNFMKYCSAESVRAEKHIDKRIRDLTLSFR